MAGLGAGPLPGGLGQVPGGWGQVPGGPGSALGGVGAIPGAIVPSSRFPVTSRYATTPIAGFVDAAGVTHPYLRRRLVPPPEQFAAIGEHTVTQSDRLDRLAATYLGDPEQYWLLCDANRATTPDTLTATPGRRLRITLPAGVPGPAPYA